MNDNIRYDLFRDKTFIFYFIIATVSFAFQILSLFKIQLPFEIALPFFALICMVSGREIFAKGLQSLFRFNFSSINTLITIAVAGAFYLQEFPEAAVITSLFAMSEHLESFGLKKSKSALIKLEKDLPDVARIVSSGKKVPLKKINKGEVIKILAGERIPLDGIIVNGSADVDLSVITGESIPVLKSSGDEVISGSICLNGTLEVRTTSEFNESTVSRILDLAFNASKSKSGTQLFIEKFSSVYTPLIIVLAVLLYVIPVLFLGLDSNLWLTQSLSLLIIACPCALVISTPISVYSALGNAFAKGVVFKGSRAVESAANIKVVAFDKTGTITHGRPEVVSFETVSKNFRKDEILKIAGTLASHSTHPVSVSVIEFLKLNNIDTSSAKEIKLSSGLGLQGMINGEDYYLGSKNFVEKVSGNFDAIISHENGSVVLIANKTEVLGIFYLRDQLREEIKTTIEELNNQGIESVILSGDNLNIVKVTAEQSGIKRFYGELLPEQKLKIINELQESNMKTAMIGDGINDAPSLAASDLGISFGKNVSELASENSDVILIKNDLRLLPFIFKLGNATIKIIRFNIIFSIFVKAIFVTLALAGLANLFMAILADVGLSIFVIFNSLRLMKYRFD